MDGTGLILPLLGLYKGTWYLGTTKIAENGKAGVLGVLKRLIDEDRGVVGFIWATIYSLENASRSLSYIEHMIEIANLCLKGVK